MASRSAISSLILAGLFILFAAGCDNATGTDGDPFVETADHLSVVHSEDLLFFTQDTVHQTQMDALFQGSITADEEGCLRLETLGDYGVTPVWPQGYELARDDGTVIIRDSAGDPLGSLGDSFTFAGGEVDTLLESLGFTDDDRLLAASRCPGKYWIVAGS